MDKNTPKVKEFRMIKLNPSPKIRLAIYITVGLANIVAGYLVEKGSIGVNEVMLLNGISAFVMGLAGVNVGTQDEL